MEKFPGPKFFLSGSGLSQMLASRNSSTVGPLYSVVLPGPVLNIQVLLLSIY